MTPTQTSSESSNPNFIAKVNFAPEPPKLIKEDVHTDTILQTPDSVEPPIQIYEEKHGEPYLVKMLDISGLYGKTGFEPQIGVINDYVIDAIEDRGYKSDTSAYQSVIDELKRDANISEQHDYEEQIRKLSIIVMVKTKQKQLRNIMEALNGPTDK